MLENSINLIREKLKRLSASDVLIVAATKTVEPERINLLKDYGVMDAGENRVQELIEKYDKVQGINWHFIGKLQRNKVKYIVDKVKLIHSVDSLELAAEIEKRASKIDKNIDILIEVNIGREQAKSGVFEEELDILCEQIKMLSHITIKGLMAIMPINADELLYKKMNELFQAAKSKYDTIQFLSVGMSNDYEIAVKNGANLIRPGSLIFGKRA